MNLGSFFRLPTYIYRLIVSSLFFVLAIWDPVSRDSTDSGKKSGVPVMIMLDVSQSMLVGDMKVPKNLIARSGKITPDSRLTRLERSKYALQQLLISQPNNFYGLGVFAGDAQGIIPLTNNTEQFLTLLTGIDSNNVYTQGTDLSSALSYGARRLLSPGNSYIDIPDQEKKGILLLISDGGDEVLGDIELPDTKQLDIYVAGIGTKEGGPIIQGRDPFGGWVYKRFQGEIVQSVLNEAALTQLSKKLDATYIHLEDDGSLDDLIDHLEDIKKITYMTELNTRRSLGLVRVGIALFCFLGYICTCLLSGKRN